MKKVLFVTYDFPYPTNTGGKNRAYHMLKYSGNEVKKYLFSFIRGDFEKEYIKALVKIGVEVVGTEHRRKVGDVRNVFGLISGQSIFKTLYYSNKILADLLRIIVDKKIDIVHFESFYTAFYISDEIRKKGVKQVFGTENIEFKLYEDYAKGKSLMFLYDFQVKKIKEEEISMYKKSDLCIAVTADEVKFIKQFNGNCVQIPNGVDINDFTFNKPIRKNAINLLFVGNFTYFPNVEAINSFYNEIFEKLSKDVLLTIIGKEVGMLSAARDKRVRAIEFIDDIKNAYRTADILISPVRIGGGTNFKVLEAMAAGVPVISFGGRASALGAQDNKHLLIAENNEEFNDKIKELLSNFALRQKLAEGARKFIEERYSWEAIGSKLERVWKEL